MKIVERIVIVSIFLALFVGGGAIYYGVKKEQAEVRDAVARGEYERPIESDQPPVEPEDWRTIYPTTIPIQIGETTVLASVADTMTSRIKGLSNTPFLPDNVVKLFVFGTEGEHSIWMKDMNYALDIMWATEDGEVVHIEPNVSPDSFPDSYASPIPAWYVIEANAGFAASNTIVVGDRVILPTE